MSRQSSSTSLGGAYYNTEEGSFGVLNFRDLGISSADNPEHKKYIIYTSFSKTLDSHCYIGM